MNKKVEEKMENVEKEIESLKEEMLEKNNNLVNLLIDNSIKNNVNIMNLVDSKLNNTEYSDDNKKLISDIVHSVLSYLSTIEVYTDLVINTDKDENLNSTFIELKNRLNRFKDSLSNNIDNIDYYKDIVNVLNTLLKANFLDLSRLYTNNHTQITKVIKGEDLSDLMLILLFSYSKSISSVGIDYLTRYSTGPYIDSLILTSFNPNKEEDNDLDLYGYAFDVYSNPSDKSKLIYTIHSININDINSILKELKLDNTSNLGEYKERIKECRKLMNKKVEYTTTFDNVYSFTLAYLLLQSVFEGLSNERILIEKGSINIEDHDMDSDENKIRMRVTSELSHDKNEVTNILKFVTRFIIGN